MPLDAPLTSFQVTTADVSGETPAVVAARLNNLRAVLLAHGIRDLSALGTLALKGPLVPAAGLSTPATGVGPARSLVHSAPVARWGVTAGHDTLTLESWGGQGLTPGVMAPIAPAASTMTIPFAFWVANEIVLGDDTQVVFKYPCASLVLLATTIRCGRNVTFTYERPIQSSPAVPPKPATPPAQGTSTTIDNAPVGTDGRPGRAGGRGAAGIDAPAVQFWALDLDGHPTFVLTGQDGARGGTGGDGGDGGRGARGRGDRVDSFGFCSSGPGNGGRGGAGGQAGDGGPGGAGGRGGQLNLYAPAEVLQRYITTFSISTDGGRGGAGGRAGNPGQGGPGGSRGDNSHNCRPSHPRSDGQPGPRGGLGDEGPAGAPGEPGGVSMSAITRQDFVLALSTPRIVSLSVLAAAVGETVTILGANLHPDDQIWVGPIGRDPASGIATIAEGTRASMSPGGDTMASLVLPAVRGGMTGVQVRRSSGANSNVATIYVTPSLHHVEPEGRIWPGSRVRIKGSGFAPGAQLLVNGIQSPAPRFVDQATLEATILRPDDVAPMPAGEPITLQVVLADGGAHSRSGTIDGVLETIRLHVIGDSIAWGQGLSEEDKVSSRLIRQIQAANGGIGVYQSRTAHSGATIGVDDSTPLGPLDGEVPSSYPTVLQQVASFDDSPETVDLVLLSAGINDVGVQEILVGTLTGPDLSHRIERHCHSHMTTLLHAVHDRFPNATVLVTGYYQIVSEETDTGLLGALLLALGATIGPVVPILTLAERANISNRCALFHHRSTDALRRAVAEAVGEEPAWAHFIDPGFQPAHAALTPGTRLWGIDIDLSPQDPADVAHGRAVSCLKAGGRAPWYCEVASAGHPNPAGATAYAEALTPTVLAAVARPAATVTT